MKIENFMNFIIEEKELKDYKLLLEVFEVDDLPAEYAFSSLFIYDQTKTANHKIS